MKPLKVILLDEAVEDLDLGRAFYEEKELGVGSYFVMSLLSDVTSLELYSGIHSIHFGYYRMLSRRFPFAVYYEIVAEVSRVVAVLDMRQDPESIRTTLKKRKSQPNEDGNG